MIKYIIWDFDGVICDSKNIAFDVHNIIRQKYEKLPKINNELEYSKLMNVEYDESLEKYLSKEEKDNYFLEHREEMYNRKSEFKIFKTIVDFIRDNNIPSIIVTATYEKLVRYVLKNNGYDDNIFKYILGRETKGGKTEKVESICKILNLKKDEVIYIGDTINDVLFCNKMGINIICVGYGYCPIKIFKEHEILNLSETQKELIEYIKKINR